MTNCGYCASLVEALAFWTPKYDNYNTFCERRWLIFIFVEESVSDFQAQKLIPNDAGDGRTHELLVLVGVRVVHVVLHEHADVQVDVAHVLVHGSQSPNVLKKTDRV